MGSPQPEGFSQCEGEKLDTLDRTLWDLFSKTATDHPDRDAIISMWQTDADQSSVSSPGDLGAIQIPNLTTPKYLRWSYKELHYRAIILSSWLSKHACQPQHRVAAFLWNSVEWGLFFWACTRLGLVYMPLDPRLTASEGDFLLKSTNPTVVVAQDAAEAAALDSLLATIDPEATIIRIQCSGLPLPGWTLLQEILETTPDGSPTDHEITHESGPTSPSDTTLVVFTSGTTSTPKGCLHTHSNLIAQIHTYDPNPDPDHIDRWLVHTPSCHIFAVNNALRAFHLGQAVIFPSKAFDIQATLKALVDEQCTIMSAVPTLIKALLANPLFPGKEALNVGLVTIGGTIITPDDIRLCKEGLGAEYAIQAFGMSEGAPVISWCRPDPLLADGYHPGVGKTLPGANIRVCVPGTRDLVPRGEVGELHIGGSQIISGYLGDVESHNFYHDETGNWLVTGDQARMDDDGVIYILGRYKDLIIRAGENISPLKMEAAIGEIPGVVVQIVGIPDEFAGQVPVAVVKIAEDTMVSKKDIMSKCRGLGSMFTLDGVYLLSELGMETFPMTSLGKIKKEQLKRAVAELRQPKPEPQLSRTSNGVKAGDVPSHVVTRSVQPELESTANGRNSGTDNTTQPPGVTDQLAGIWEDLIGQRPGLDDEVSSFADSITILRFCDRVLNVIGQRLYLQDFLDHDTVNKQAALLEQRSKQEMPVPDFGSSFKSSMNERKLGPFAQIKANGEHSLGTSSKATNGTAGTYLPVPGKPLAPKTLVSQELDLYSAAAQAAINTGFELDDIEDILHIRGNYIRLATGPRPHSWHIRPFFRVSDSYTVAHIRQALEAGLTSRSIFRTILAQLPNGNPFHVILRPSHLLFNSQITNTTVPDPGSKDQLTKSGFKDSHTSPFMARFEIITVQDPPETILSITYNHSIVDALSLLAWHLDLERLLFNPNTSLAPLTTYKPFTDLYHLYQTSLPAQLSIEHTVSRLRGISRFKDALWPIQRSPGWMLFDEGCPEEISLARATTREQLWDNKWTSHYAKEYHSVPRVARNISLTGIEWLRLEKNIEPSLLMKCAIAVFNVLQTGSKYAVFNTIHVGRSWPFVPGWMEGILPPAMSIAGPTTEWTLEMVEVGRDETVGALLERMRGEHEVLERHCHVPWGEVLKGLGGGEESAVAEDASFRQSFVWDVSIGLGVAGGLDPGREKVLEAVGRYDWADW